jgi:hypothetical protein
MMFCVGVSDITTSEAGGDVSVVGGFEVASFCADPLFVLFGLPKGFFVPLGKEAVS